MRNGSKGLRMMAVAALASGAMLAGHARPAAAQRMSDANILQAEMTANQNEVASARYVQAHAHAAAVRTYAAMLVRDHSAGLSQNRATARAAHVTPRAMPGDDSAAKQRELMQRLRSLHGAALDKAYIDHAVDDHREDIQKAHTMESQAHAAAVRRMVHGTLPVLQKHLDRALALQKRM
ncbi:MAG TPA: DUF4142 domain-containing protein [Longimicrobiaceae bacterium]|nr:DUF4142 domain-containing protein [Longimicrobiaceae bacterium]